MKAMWKNKHKSMGGYRCASLEGSDENCLAGELGEIWENKGSMLPRTYKAFIVDSTGNENLFTFSYSNLARWVLKLKVPIDPNEQADWANNPNMRFYAIKVGN